MVLMHTIIETETKKPVYKDASASNLPGRSLSFFFVWLYGNPAPTHPIAASTSPSKKKMGGGRLDADAGWVGSGS